MVTPTALVPSRWQRSQLAETVASDHVSATCYRGTEDIGVHAVVVAEQASSLGKAASNWATVICGICVICLRAMTALPIDKGEYRMSKSIRPGSSPSG